jgi:hypothetical protein
LDVVLNNGSITVTEDEAISIFQSAYPDIKALAGGGDTEAMLMVAEGIRYGFVDDDEPYMYWVSRASALGDAKADKILDEYDREESPLYLPSPETMPERYEQDTKDDVLAVVPVGEKKLNIGEIPDECVLIADADFLVRDELGIDDYLRERQMEKNSMNVSEWYD